MHKIVLLDKPRENPGELDWSPLQALGETVFYALSAAQDRQAVTLNVGDRITLDHALPGEEETDILDAYALTIDGRGSSQTVAPDLAAG